jgi:large subunit ribosomal protein L15
LDQLEQFSAGSVVNPETLHEARLLRKPKNPVAILGRGDVTVALVVQVHRVSQGARAKIEAAGGRIEIVPLED